MMVFDHSVLVLLFLLSLFVMLPRTASFHYKNINNIRNNISRKLVTEQAGQNIANDLQAALKDLKEFDDACT